MKIATVCRPDLRAFLPPIEQLLRGRHEVRSGMTAGGDVMVEAVEAADVVWCEWANEIAQALATHTKARLVVRMHRYEVYSDTFRRIPWRNVAALIVTSEHVLEAACEKVPALRDLTRCVVIPSGIDFAKFPRVEKTRAAMRRLGVVAYIHGRKQPAEWLHVLRFLPREYTLHVAGRPQQPEWIPYLTHLAKRLGVEDRFHFDGWQDDVSAWWSDKGHCLSAAMDEGCPYNLIEAAASGVLPWLHNYPGAEKQWPYRFRWDTPEEAAEKIQRAEDGECLAFRGLRDWARERYDLASQADALFDVVEGAAAVEAAA